MRKEDVLAQFTVQSASEIDCPASERALSRVRLIRRRLGPALGVVMVAGSVVLVANVTLWGFDLRAALIAIVVFAAFIIILPLLYWVDMAPADLRQGVLMLPYRVRRRDGTRANRFDLADVSRGQAQEVLYNVPNAETVVTRAALGLTLVFGDGTKLFLEQARFGGRGMEVLEKIARLHGTSYIETTKNGLMGPGYPRFHVWDVRGFRDGNVILKRPIRTYSSGQTKVLRPGDVLTLELLKTNFGVDGYLITRTDGLMLLLPREPLDRLGVPLAPGWAERMVE